jgi:putative glutamine amidotransferase
MAPPASRHRQAIDRLGKGLIVTARDPVCGMIEAVSLPPKNVMGVRWHPEEMLHDPIQRRLFEAFRNAF